VRTKRKMKSENRQRELRSAAQQRNHTYPGRVVILHRQAHRLLRGGAVGVVDSALATIRRSRVTSPSACTMAARFVSDRWHPAAQWRLKGAPFHR
jgi:hypothetical protein